MAAAVPDEALWLDLEDLDQPLAGRHCASHADVQDAVSSHIAADLRVRAGGGHPETLALFLGLLRAYMDLGQLVPADRPTAALQGTIQGWWHGFFSFVDSGPPPHRLRQILAIHKAGLLEFLGPSLTVAAEEGTGLFLATSGQGGTGLRATAFIEARLPAPSVVRSANPVLVNLQANGIGSGQQLLSADGTVSTGRLLVSDTHHVVGPAVNRQGIFMLWDRAPRPRVLAPLPAPVAMRHLFGKTTPWPVRCCAPWRRCHPARLAHHPHNLHHRNFLNGHPHDLCHRPATPRQGTPAGPR